MKFSDSVGARFISGDELAARGRFDIVNARLLDTRLGKQIAYDVLTVDPATNTYETRTLTLAVSDYRMTVATAAQEAYAKGELLEGVRLETVETDKNETGKAYVFRPVEDKNDDEPPF